MLRWFIRVNDTLFWADTRQELIREFTGAGLFVNVWTENTPERMHALIDAGVTGIFTDYPNRLTNVLAGERT